MTDMSPIARAAQAWLRGFSDHRAGKPDGARELYPDSGRLRDEYLAGRLAGRRTVAGVQEAA